MTALVSADADLFATTAARVGRDVLAPAADDVDARSRFPHEAIEAFRAEGMLGALVPVEFGGGGLTVEAVARAVTELAKHCSSAAMVFAMHQIQVASLVRHGGSPDYLRQIASDGLLLASATTEVGIGGDVRSSSCAVVASGDRIALRKQAPVISYGEYADGILATARRGPDSPPSDQVLVICRRGSYTLEPTSEWDALGFRGTCSRGFVLDVEASADDVLPVPYADISAQTMLPVSHVLWSSLWLGIAAAAEGKARAFVQKAARKDPSAPPPGALRLSELTVVLQQLRQLVEGGRRQYEASLDSADTGLSFAVAMNALKVSASTLVVDVVQRSLTICGMAGYGNRSPFSLGRLLRDSYGAQLMVNNDRIHANTSQLLLVYRGEV